jgi:hypothetical protein
MRRLSPYSRMHRLDHSHGTGGACRRLQRSHGQTTQGPGKRQASLVESKLTQQILLQSSFTWARGVLAFLPLGSQWPDRRTYYLATQGTIPRAHSACVTVVKAILRSGPFIQACRFSFVLPKNIKSFYNHEGPSWLLESKTSVSHGLARKVLSNKARPHILQLHCRSKKLGGYSYYIYVAVKCGG